MTETYISPRVRAFDAYWKTRRESNEWKNVDFITEAFNAGWNAAPDYEEYRDYLKDLLDLQCEYEALTGGGPGWSQRWRETLRKANELFEP